MVASTAECRYRCASRRRLRIIKGTPIPARAGRCFAVRRAGLVPAAVNGGSSRRRLRGAISHQLRTPLTVIKGYVDLMLRSWSTLDDDSRLAFLRVIQQHVEELRGQVDNAILAMELTAIEEEFLRVN